LKNNSDGIAPVSGKTGLVLCKHWASLPRGRAKTGPAGAPSANRAACLTDRASGASVFAYPVHGKALPKYGITLSKYDRYCQRNDDDGKQQAPPESGFFSDVIARDRFLGCGGEPGEQRRWG
jgi:hypothetical protein